MTPSFVQTRRIVAGVMLALCVVASAFGATVRFDIPAQAAPAALQRFMQQSGTQVMFVADELRQVTTQAVQGEMEPAAALAAMLKGTGYTAVENKPGWFAVVRDEARKAATTGAVRGNLAQENGVPAAGVLVELRESGQVVRTDRNGEFFFGSVAPGTYLLVATAEGCQQLHVTDVVVRAGSELTLSMERMRPAGGAVELAPYVVKAETVERLEKFEVTDTKAKPFSDANVDRPRTINDAQPYYIYNAKAIDQSGATNLEEFLNQRVSMNSVFGTNAQSYGIGSGVGGNLPGNTSQINLNGLGVDHTLVLVNGRRMAGVVFAANGNQSQGQPDLNGIPLAAVDRIEILPTSASGIYGGSAIGGVVNVVLKREYAGLELASTYENTWDTDAPDRSFSATYGGTLGGGRTRLLLSGSYADSKPLLLQDRVNLVNRGYAKILANSPQFLTGARGNVPLLGQTPNIGTVTAGRILTLKGTGASLNSSIATLPAGYSVSSNPATIVGGQWNLGLPDSNALPNGLLVPLGRANRTKSFLAEVRHDLTPRVELFADFSYAGNSSVGEQNPLFFFQLFPALVPASAPTNPFNQDVRVAFPFTLRAPVVGNSLTRSFTIGALVDLPGNWRGEVDYSWSGSEFSNRYTAADPTALRAAYRSGAVNPFVDTIRYPINFAPYLYEYSYFFPSTLNDLAVRASGPVGHFGTSSPLVSAAVERVRQGSREGLGTTAETRISYLGQTQTTTSAYLEGDLPLVAPSRRIRLVEALDLQATYRRDAYSVSTGTATKYTSIASGDVSFGDPTLNGAPYRSVADYAASNSSLGLKYAPVQGLTFRGSRSTAFLPPTFSQLLPNPDPDPYTTTVADPKTGAVYDVGTISGGNRQLKPQTSRSWNLGAIWEPGAGALKGLRVNLEYYRIRQFNQIGALDAQTIIDTPELGYRVTRDSATGLITLVDASLINLTQLDSSGWNLSVDYTMNTSLGTFDLFGTGTAITHERRQVTSSAELLDYAGYPGDGGEARVKATVSLGWERFGWSAGWTYRHTGSYHQSGAPGGPNGDGYTYFTLPQGGTTIPSQGYHDLFVGYRFGSGGAAANGRNEGGLGRWTRGLSIQVGVKNVLNTLPPYDVINSPYYYSPYGDIRLRQFAIKIRKSL